MTCIVGLVYKGATYIGGDSLGSNGHSKTVRNDKKVFHMKDINNAIAGYTSSFRMGQLLMYGTGLIDSREYDTIDHKYLVTKFVPNIIKLFEEGGYAKTSRGEKEGGTFLFAFKDKLYKIESDYQVGEPFLPYIACGSGEDFALGSLHATQGLINDPLERIHKALQAASEFTVSVAPPYFVVNTADNKTMEYNN
jgi:ATP-dependent protease HslVU (ClpYQ) peptidase subunit